MCHLWLQVLPVDYDIARGDPRMVLQEALARHNVGKNPGDFEAAPGSALPALPWWFK